jgi:hypothetical protein
MVWLILCPYNTITALCEGKEHPGKIREMVRDKEARTNIMCERDDTLLRMVEGKV